MKYWKILLSIASPDFAKWKWDPHSKVPSSTRLRVPNTSLTLLVLQIRYPPYAGVMHLFQDLPCFERAWRSGFLKAEKMGFLMPRNKMIVFLFWKVLSRRVFTEGQRSFSGMRNLFSHFRKLLSGDVHQWKIARRMRLLSKILEDTKVVSTH